MGGGLPGMDQDPAMSLSCRASFSADEQRCGCAATRAGARRGEPNPNARRRTAGPTGGDTGQPSSRKTLSLARQVQGTVTQFDRNEKSHKLD